MVAVGELFLLEVLVFLEVPDWLLEGVASEGIGQLLRNVDFEDSCFAGSDQRLQSDSNFVCLGNPDALDSRLEIREPKV